MTNNAKSKHSKGKTLFRFLLCLTPLLSFVIIQPEWLARLIAVAGCTLAFNTLIFYYGFNLKINFIDFEHSKWKNQSEKTRQFGQRFLRTLTILSGCFLFWFLTIPVVVDCIKISQVGEKYLIHLEGEVTSDSLSRGRYGSAPHWILQNITVSENGQPTGESYAALFYSMYLGHTNQLRQFLIAPRSHLVLECRNIDFGGDFKLMSR
jgi:hypothetical protein